MFCLNCGAQLPDGSNFCNNCGASLDEEAHKVEISEENKSLSITMTAA